MNWNIITSTHSICSSTQAWSCVQQWRWIVGDSCTIQQCTLRELVNAWNFLTLCFVLQYTPRFFTVHCVVTWTVVRPLRWNEEFCLISGSIVSQTMWPGTAMSPVVQFQLRREILLSFLVKQETPVSFTFNHAGRTSCHQSWLNKRMQSSVFTEQEHPVIGFHWTNRFSCWLYFVSKSSQTLLHSRSSHCWYYQTALQPKK